MFKKPRLWGEIALLRRIWKVSFIFFSYLYLQGWFGGFRVFILKKTGKTVTQCQEERRQASNNTFKIVAWVICAGIKVLSQVFWVKTKLRLIRCLTIFFWNLLHFERMQYMYFIWVEIKSHFIIKAQPNMFSYKFEIFR